MAGTNGNSLLLKLGSQNMMTLANCRIGDLITIYALKSGEVVGLMGEVSDILFSPHPNSHRIFVYLKLCLETEKTMALCNTLNGAVEFQTIH